MSDSETWIEERLASAVESATTDTHEFPEALVEELQKLLSGPFQEARKPAEIESIATSLIFTNRGTK